MTHSAFTTITVLVHLTSYALTHSLLQPNKLPRTRTSKHTALLISPWNRLHPVPPIFLPSLVTCQIPPTHQAAPHDTPTINQKESSPPHASSKTCDACQPDASSWAVACASPQGSLEESATHPHLDIPACRCWRLVRVTVIDSLAHFPPREHCKISLHCVLIMDGCGNIWSLILSHQEEDK